MIIGNKIIIRPLKESELRDFFSLREGLINHFEILPDDLGSEYLFKKNFEETALWKADEGTAVILNKKEKIVGSIWFDKMKRWDACEVSYAIFLEEDRGKGYMSEALNLFSIYLFATRRIYRLQLSIPDYHRASIAVAQKCGYTFEGIARQTVFARGKYIDLCLYSLLRAECKNIEQFF